MNNGTNKTKILPREIVMLILGACMLIAVCFVAYQNSRLSQDIFGLQKPITNDIPHMAEAIVSLQKEVATINTTVVDVKSGLKSLTDNLQVYLEADKKKQEQFGAMREEISGLRTDFKSFIKEMQKSIPSKPD